ncbi:MAG: hypothetical protein ACE5H4_15715 [Candidatus Thorarchaeota archaeon]
MKKASSARERYYLDLDTRVNAVLQGKLEQDVGENLIRIMQTDLIFNLVRTIEAFAGAVLVCWTVCTGSDNERSASNLLHILLAPKASQLKEIYAILAQDELTNDTLYKLCGFPIPSEMSISKKQKIALENICDQTLKRMKVYGSLAVKYWEKFRQVRNAYAHNTRILFLESYQTGKEAPEEAKVFGLLNPRTRRPGNMGLLCDSQRKAMGELMVRLCAFERLLYENLIFSVHNDCTPVLPVKAYHAPERFEEELLKMKIDSGYDYQIPAYRVEIKAEAEFDLQFKLHIQLLEKISKLGTRI